MLLCCSAFAALAQDTHNYLHNLYDRLHYSEEQAKYRKLAPMPAGVVYIQRPEDGEGEMRWHFRKMKELGFTNLKQIMSAPGWTIEQIQLIALEEGIIPWWYGDGGWETITDDLLKELGISRKLSLSEVRQHPEMQEWQTSRLRERIEKTMEYRKNPEDGQVPKGSMTAFDPTVGDRGLELTEKGAELFVEWSREQYKSIEELNKAYNLHHAGLLPMGGAFTSWQDFEQRWQDFNHREYRVRRDILRFKAEHGIRNIAQKVQAYKTFYPEAPFRGGGEMGLFLPQAWFGVDFEGIAELMKDAGSFYPSIHFSWHFDQVQNELVRPFYMQTSFMTDLFKGGWTGGWETTGGPQQFDGEKYGPRRGFYVDGGTLKQFFMSHLAGGFKGFGIWCWNPRTAGKEAGEYALLGRNNEVTDRAIQVGLIGKAMQRYRDELWAAHKEPYVGVLIDWNNEAVWAAMSDRGQDNFRMRPIEARVGVSRALINSNVPFEYVTPDDLRKGLAARYRVIYLPSMLAITSDVMEILKGYVQEGGRLVMDMPGGWYNEYATMLDTGEGSLFQEVFGATIPDFQYAGNNRDFHINGMRIAGAMAMPQTRKATVLASFDEGGNAITEYKNGKGTAVILGYNAATMCFEPGHEQAEKTLVQHTLGSYSPPYACEGAIVYRLASEKADHYFFMNDGPARKVRFDTGDYRYSRVTDALTGETLQPGDPVDLEGHSARWLRFER